MHSFSYRSGQIKHSKLIHRIGSTHERREVSKVSKNVYKVVILAKIYRLLMMNFRGALVRFNPRTASNPV
jgi:hypothetical protein